MSAMDSIWESMAAMSSMWTQWWPPSPQFTEANLPSQKGKVFIVTGGNSGVGFELVKILYRSGAKIYIAGRSEQRVTDAIRKIETLYPADVRRELGELRFLYLDLADLSTIKTSANAFKARESKLDVLWNNAGCAPRAGLVSPQGVELTIATNCVGPWLFTQLLLPELRAAAQDSVREQDSVRVIWTSSIMVETNAPPGGLNVVDLDSLPKKQVQNYAISKVGNWLLAVEMAKRVSKDGIVSLTQNPGSLWSKVWRDASFLLFFSVWLFLSRPEMGAYTMLWAGLAPDVTMQHAGGYSVPWGRWHPSPRKDVVLAMRSKEEGGKQLAEEFWKWCEAKAEPYL